MSRLWKNGPPVLRALAAQGVAFLATLVLAGALAAHVPSWVWPLSQGALAAGLAAIWGLNTGWLLFQVLLPLALAWQLGHTVPFWIYPLALAGLLLVFGGGILTRVPLYNSNRAAWKALAGLLPSEEGFRMVDLGAGLGGPLAFLARLRPGGRFLGIEGSPLVWLIAWIRTAGVRANCRMDFGDLWKVHLGEYQVVYAFLARLRPGGRFLGIEGSPLVWLIAWIRTAGVRANCRMDFGDLWKVPLGDFQVVYAFLSPAPMPRLWAKARQEMQPGALLISHTFQIPGVLPEREIPLPGRKDARLLVYRL